MLGQTCDRVRAGYGKIRDAIRCQAALRCATGTWPALWEARAIERRAAQPRVKGRWAWSNAPSSWPMATT